MKASQRSIKYTAFGALLSIGGAALIPLHTATAAEAYLQDDYKDVIIGLGYLIPVLENDSIEGELGVDYSITEVSVVSPEDMGAQAHVYNGEQISASAMEPGIYSFTYTVDGPALDAPQSATVTMHARSSIPSTVVDDSFKVVAGSTTVLDVGANDWDSSADAEIVAITGVNGTGNYAYNVGNGRIEFYAYAQPGVYEFQYTRWGSAPEYGGDGITGTVTVEITPAPTFDFTAILIPFLEIEDGADAATEHRIDLTQYLTATVDGEPVDASAYLDDIEITGTPSAGTARIEGHTLVYTLGAMSDAELDALRATTQTVELSITNTLTGRAQPIDVRYRIAPLAPLLFNFDVEVENDLGGELTPEGLTFVLTGGDLAEPITWKQGGEDSSLWLPRGDYRVEVQGVPAGYQFVSVRDNGGKGFMGEIDFAFDEAGTAWTFTSPTIYGEREGSGNAGSILTLRQVALPEPEQPEVPVVEEPQEPVVVPEPEVPVDEEPPVSTPVDTPQVAVETPAEVVAVPEQPVVPETVQPLAPERVESGQYRTGIAGAVALVLAGLGAMYSLRTRGMHRA